MHRFCIANEELLPTNKPSSYSTRAGVPKWQPTHQIRPTKSIESKIYKVLPNGKRPGGYQASAARSMRKTLILYRCTKTMNVATSCQSIVLADIVIFSSFTHVSESVNGNGLGRPRIVGSNPDHSHFVVSLGKTLYLNCSSPPM